MSDTPYTPESLLEIAMFKARDPYGYSRTYAAWLDTYMCYKRARGAVDAELEHLAHFYNTWYSLLLFYDGKWRLIKYWHNGNY